jgi:hypothetical protein
MDMDTKAVEKALRDLTDGVNEFRTEFRTELLRLDNRVTRLESEGLPQIALERLKRIDQRLDDHVKSEDKWRITIDDRLDKQVQEMARMANTTASTSNILSQLQSEMIREGRQAGLKSGAIAGTLMPIVAGLVYGALQFIGG